MAAEAYETEAEIAERYLFLTFRQDGVEAMDAVIKRTQDIVRKEIDEEAKDAARP